MASEFASMAPQKHLRPYRLRNEEAVRRTVAWPGISTLGPSDLCFDVHGDHPNDAGSRDNGLRLGRGPLWCMESGQCVSLGVTRARSVGKGIVESIQELCPSCLTRVKAFGSPDEG